MYKQTIRPLLEYSSFIFNSGKELKVDTIDKIQSKCIRIIEYSQDKSSQRGENILCDDYNLSSLQQEVIRNWHV